MRISIYVSHVNRLERLAYMSLCVLVLAQSFDFSHCSVPAFVPKNLSQPAPCIL